MLAYSKQKRHNTPKGDITFQVADSYSEIVYNDQRVKRMADADMSYKVYYSMLNY